MARIMILQRKGLLLMFVVLSQGIVNILMMIVEEVIALEGVLGLIVLKIRFVVKAGSKMNKGQLSMNVLVVAAIAIIVMIVVIAMFAGKFRKVSTDIETCGLRGGNCQTTCDPRNGEVRIPNVKCPDLQDCCVKYTSDEDEE